MKAQKLYFRDIDDTWCQPIEGLIQDAKHDGLQKITLVEAVPSTDFNSIWCSYNGEVVDRNECKKSICPYYESKSGRGVCENRGKLYTHGDEVEFKVL